MTTCYCLLILDATGPNIIGAGLFSEPSPTLGGNRRCLVVEQCTAPTYTEAERTLRRMLASPWHSWVLPILKERGV